MALILSCDIGTHMTYLVARDDTTDQLSHIHVPTHTHNPSLSLNTALEKLDKPLENAIRFVLCGVPFYLYESYLDNFPDSHCASNTSKKFALITNLGVQDILDLYNTRLTPILLQTFPKEVRLELPCRLTARGEELIDLNKDHITKILHSHLEAVKDRIDGFCVSLMHSDLNLVHERDILKLCYELWPEGIHLASHEVTKSGSYAERTFMTAATLTYQDSFDTFFSQLYLDLKKNGFNGDLLLVGRQQNYIDARYPLIFEQKNLPYSQNQITPRLTALEIFGASQINMLQANAYHSASRSYGDCFIIDIGATQSCISHTRLMTDPARQSHPRIHAFLQTSENDHALWHIPVSDHRNYGAHSHIHLDHLALYHFAEYYSFPSQRPPQRPQGISVIEAAILLGYAANDNKTISPLETQRLKEILSTDISHTLNQDILKTASDIFDFAVADFSHWAQKWVSLNLANISVDSVHPNTLICSGGFAPLIGAKIAKIIGCRKVIIPAKAPFLSCYWGQLAGLTRQTNRQIMRPLSVITHDILTQIFDTLTYQHHLSIQAEQMHEVNLLNKFSVTLLNQETLTTDCFWIESLQNPHQSLLKYIYPDQDNTFYRGSDHDILLSKYILLSVGVTSCHRLDSTFLPPNQFDNSGSHSHQTPQPIAIRDVMINQRIQQIPVYQKSQFTHKTSLIGPALIEDQGFCCYAPKNSHIEIAESEDIILTLSDNLS